MVDWPITIQEARKIALAILARAGQERLDFAEVGVQHAGPTWAGLIDELLRILQLEDNWDGEGAVAPSPAVVESAVRLAKTLQAKEYPPAGRVIATVNGTISFEWLTPLGYCDIEVMSPNEAEYSWTPKSLGIAQVCRLKLGGLS